VVNQRSWSGLCINVHWPLIITYWIQIKRRSQTAAFDSSMV
jgi:hypothetical protein